VTANIDGKTERTGSRRGAIRRACEAYSAINYGNDEVCDSVVCLGVIGAQTDVVKRALAVNSAKAELQELFASLQRVRIRVPVKESHTKAIPTLRVILRHIQRSDLNVNAAYRKIPILAAPPASVTYTRANTRNVYRKTIDEVAEMLANIASPEAIADRQRLNTLDRRETHLALVRCRRGGARDGVLTRAVVPLDSRSTVSPPWMPPSSAMLFGPRRFGILASLRTANTSMYWRSPACGPPCPRPARRVRRA
jgi:hypothetical protein